MNWEPKRGIKDSVKSILTKINQWYR
jgi:hypothetical protein